MPKEKCKYNTVLELLVLDTLAEAILQYAHAYVLLYI